MARMKFIEMLKSFTYPGKEYRYKYLVVNKEREYQTSRDDAIYRAELFMTKKEVKDFLNYQVAKADLEDWKIFVLVTEPTKEKL